MRGSYENKGLDPFYRSKINDFKNWNHELTQINTKKHKRYCFFEYRPGRQAKHNPQSPNRRVAPATPDWPTKLATAPRFAASVLTLGQPGNKE
jgi:hypothetical protein